MATQAEQSTGHDHFLPTVSGADDMLSDIEKLLGSIHHEYEYWINPAWVSGVHLCPQQGSDCCIGGAIAEHAVKALAPA